YLHDPRLRMLVDRYATYSGSDPRRAPAALAVIPYVEQAFGAWYVDGGLHVLARAIADRASDLGAQLITSARVAAIEAEGDRVGGVRLEDGTRLPADIVVANAEASTVYRDLLPDSRKTAAARRRLARTTPSYSGFVLLLGL